MTAGALIFAFNNEQTDYVSMARWCAKNIHRHLGISTAIVTDQSFETKAHERLVHCNSVGNNGRYFADYGTNVTWHNESRTDAYSLSPWDRTLVLDSDYVVASDQLKVLLKIEQDFVVHRWAYDVTGQNNFDGLNYFGEHRMPMWWATVMMFRRSTQAQLIFDCMNMIKRNWDHYKHLYKSNTSMYRNDHALSIALGIVNGHTMNHPRIPWPLASLTPEHNLSQISTDRYRVDYITADNKKRWIELEQDFHAMGKRHLGEIIANSC